MGADPLNPSRHHHGGSRSHVLSTVVARRQGDRGQLLADPGLLHLAGIGSRGRSAIRDGHHDLPIHRQLSPRDTLHRDLHQLAPLPP